MCRRPMPTPRALRARSGSLRRRRSRLASPSLPPGSSATTVMPDRLVPVILCGGSGSRLLPMSRRLLPKHFLPLVTEHTLLQDTMLRLRGLEDCGAPVAVLYHEHRFLAAEQLQEIGVQSRSMLLDPLGRNTAPAVAVAAQHVAREDPHAVLLVLRADPLIAAAAAFHRAAPTAAAT